MRTLLLIFVISSACCWGQTTKKGLDGNQLLENCGALIKAMDANFKGAGASYGDGWCLGYLAGFTDGLDAAALMSSNGSYEQYSALRDSFICFPVGSNNGQYARIVVKYLNDHPERLHEDAKVLVASALRDAFPCQSKPAATEGAPNRSH
jgi:hypothetical protein